MKRRGDVDPSSILADLFDYVEQYRNVSALLPSDAHVLVPRVHLRGLLVELALKTYLAARGLYREGHDLVALLEMAQAEGLSVSQDQRTNVIEQLQTFYCHHDDYNWRYMSRYPFPNRPTTIWITPSHQQTDEFVSSVISQAKQQPRPKQRSELA